MMMERTMEMILSSALMDLNTQDSGERAKDLEKECIRNLNIVIYYK